MTTRGALGFEVQGAARIFASGGPACDRRGLALLGLLLGLTGPGCTDWDVDSGASQMGPFVSTGVSAAGDAQGLVGDGSSGAGVVRVDGWRPVDAGGRNSGTPDAGTPDAGTPDSGTPDSGTPDAGTPDSGTPDSGTPDSGIPDAGTPDAGTPDGGQADSGVADSSLPDSGLPDSGAPDALAPDVGIPDAGVPDTGAPDAGPTDVVTPDASPPDALPPDAGLPDAAPPDVAAPDVAVSDGGPSDLGPSDAAPSGDTWPTWTPDWGGYPDASFTDGSDIYGGVITSCFNLYSYAVSESCSFPDLSGACIDQAAKDGSLYSQFLFAPLQGCMKAKCVPDCKQDPDPKCVERCLGRECASPFFACISQGETGTNGCPETFACLDKYEDKLFSIATKCFANATSQAQQQLAGFFACGEAKQEGCVDHIAACYGPPGTLSCLKVIECADKTCPKGDDVCGFGCIGKGTPAATKKLDALWDCSVKQCSDCAGPKGCGDSCMQKHCNKEQLACVLD